MSGPRPFQDLNDIDNILSLLIEGRKANNGTYYVHTGDLRWWLFYTSQDHWENISLWEAENGDLLGWALLSPSWKAFDVFFRHDLRGTLEMEKMFTWAEQRLSETLRPAGGKQVRTMWISQTDEVLRSLLGRRGFRLSEEYMSYMVNELDLFVPDPTLPPGFRVRNVTGEAEVENRASAQYATFESNLPIDQYCQRYLRFMRSRVYSPELDVVVEAPDGKIVAFCICWLDSINRVGLFEPVGTHPAFQRKGLGKAVVSEGLKRMQAAGMRTAIVGALSDNSPSKIFYESLGFREMDRILTYAKALDN